MEAREDDGAIEKVSEVQGRIEGVFLKLTSEIEIAGDINGVVEKQIFARWGRIVLVRIDTQSPVSLKRKIFAALLIIQLL